MRHVILVHTCNEEFHNLYASPNVLLHRSNQEGWDGWGI